MITNKSIELAKECQRLAEGCLYTSTSLFIWLRWRRSLRGLFAVVPVLLGSVASWSLLTSSDLPSIKTWLSICTFVAGLLPAVYAALKFDEGVEECRVGAGAFKNLQDRFRQLALVSSRKLFAEFETEFKATRDEFEKVRSAAITPPEWCFKKAQEKVKSGDYTFDVDLTGVGDTEPE